MDKLLRLLEENGRARPEDLAAQLDRSVDEVRSAIEQYEEEGIIQGYKAIINHESLPENQTPVIGLIELKVSPQSETGFDAVAREISDHPEVTACYLCSGDFDLLVRIRGEDLKDVAEFVARELAPNPNIKSTLSHFLLRTYKQDGVRFDDSPSDHRLSITL